MARSRKVNRPPSTKMTQKLQKNTERLCVILSILGILWPIRSSQAKHFLPGKCFKLPRAFAQPRKPRSRAKTIA